MATVKKPILTDETGQAIVEALKTIGNIPIADASTAGLVKVDGKTVAISDGILNVVISEVANQIMADKKLSMGKALENVKWVGENLGKKFTKEQDDYIKAGEGYQLGLGSYWEDDAQGVLWRNMHYNKYLNKGDTPLNVQHSVVMPDGCLLKPGSHYMQDTDTTEGGYNGTKYISTYKAQCDAMFKNFFGNAVLTYRSPRSNAVAGDKVTGSSWYDCCAELPTEEMIYQTGVWGSSMYGNSGGVNVGINYGQLAAFALHPELINATREIYFLQTVGNANCFASVGANGDAGSASASATWVGLRPFALIS